MKKIIALLLCLLMVFALCCCSHNEGKNTDDDKSKDSQVIVKKEETDNKRDEVNEAVPEITDVTYDFVLYFPDNDALYLHPENRSVTIKSNESIEMKIIEELVAGPATENRWAAVKGEGLVNSAVTDENGMCTVDLKKDFAILNSGGTTYEAFVFASIVNSLCSLENIECVKFNVESDTAYEYGGHTLLDSPVYPQIDLIAK